MAKQKKKGTKARGRRVVKIVKRGGRRAIDMVQDLGFALQSYFNSPKVVMLLAAVTVLAFTHAVDKTDGVIHTWAQNHPNNWMIKLMSESFPKFLGLLAFAPTFVAIPQRSYPIIVMIVVSVCVVLLPEANFYQYMGMSFITHLYCNARIASTRILALLAFVVYFFVLHKTLQDVPHLSQLMEQLPAAITSHTTRQQATPPQQQHQRA